MRAAFAIPALCFVLLAGGPFGALAQDGAPGDPMAARLSAERVGDIEPGDYSAGDNCRFSIDSYGDKYLLRFSDSPESYVLHVERVALGGRILRYDTGATALRVSVWGGVTLYTADAPGGLPATRIGDSTALPHGPVSHNDLAAALADEGSHLAYTQQLALRFAADPSVLAGGDDARSVAFDALVSAGLGLERVLATPGGRQALAHKFTQVKLVQADKPGVSLSGKTLLVSFQPAAGPAGRASSREVAYLLGKMLAVAEPE